MNCKPGDLAVVVRSKCGNEGVILRCIRLSPKSEHKLDPRHLLVWLTDRDTVDTHGGSSPYMPDAYLRPIRDPGDDAVDETLLRLPAPSTERETA